MPYPTDACLKLRFERSIPPTHRANWIQTRSIQKFIKVLGPLGYVDLTEAVQAILAIAIAKPSAQLRQRHGVLLCCSIAASRHPTASLEVSWTCEGLSHAVTCWIVGKSHVSWVYTGKSDKHSRETSSECVASARSPDLLGLNSAAIYRKM